VILGQLQKFFVKRGFTVVESIPLGRNSGVTDLVVAGVQRYENILHSTAPMVSEDCFLAQPSVRMQFTDMVGLVEGTASAFVNICTERPGSGIEQHVQNLDLWLDALSDLGLAMNDMRLVVRLKSNDWGTGEFISHDVFCIYGGLELGDISFAVIPRKVGGTLQISDAGFGLERIAWAANKTEQFFDLLRPWTIPGSVKMHDLYRSLVLMACSGIHPGPKGAGLQFRRLAKRLFESGDIQHVQTLTPFYGNYWRGFLPVIVPIPEEVIGREIDRFRNLKLHQDYGWPPPKDERTEQYLDRLVYSGVINPNVVRQLLAP
jgi:hypothetical protein